MSQEKLLPKIEQGLLTRCQMGDMEAFGELYERYARAVFRYAYHMIGDVEEANDIMQDTFVKAHRNLAGFRGDCSLQTWLMKVAGNLCLDRVKRTNRRGDVALNSEYFPDLPDLSSRGEDPADKMERQDLHSMLYRVLDALPPAQRELIVLRDIQELSYMQIAERLSCSVASVKLRLFRARRSFKDRMQALLAER